MNKQATYTTGQNTLTAQEKTDGWQLLFDGKTSQGWHKYGGGPVGAAWKIADGTIYLDTTVKENWQVKEGGDFLTDEEFENYHLKLEWKIAKDGNSGIMFYVHEDTAKYKFPWMTGPEMQVLDNDGHPDGKILKHRAGDLYDLIKSSSEPVHGPGEWNQVEIISNKGALEFKLNGVTIVQTQLWDDAWKKLVAGSKFKEYPDFGTYTKGKICLQDHGNTVWYRNVKIKKL
ncbi:MAG: DUF1080 domain-containing protein [Chitinophagaceae bacterium]|nr:DUF1080 domain-containing protein [Chitinophagaceae bacterium]